MRFRGTRERSSENAIEVRFTPSYPKVTKKPYFSPRLVELDASAVKAKLEAEGNPKDAIALKMLSLIDGERNKRKPTSHS